MFSKFFVRSIDRQVDEYLSWKGSRYPIASVVDEPAIRRFVRFSKVGDVSDITLGHVSAFKALIVAQKATFYVEQSSMRAVRCFCRYWHARGHLCPGPGAIK